MWSEYSLEVVDAVARNGSFSAAAQELHRVPSAISYTVRQLEEWLAVPLFERRHRDVELTPAGGLVLTGRALCYQKMQITRQQCQQIANGWRGQLSIAVDDIVKPARMRQMIVDFYRHFPDVELDRLSGSVQRRMGCAGRRPCRTGDWRNAIYSGRGPLCVSRYGDAELGLRGGERSPAGEDGGTPER